MLRKTEEEGREVWRIRVIYTDREDALANSGHGEAIAECEMTNLEVDGFDSDGHEAFMKAQAPVVDEDVEKLLR